MIVWLKNNRKLTTRICFSAFLLYLFETLSSYAEWFPGSTKIFVYNSTSGLVLRMVVSILLVVSAILVYISNNHPIKKEWLFVVGIMMLTEFLSLLYTPLTYDVLFKTGQVYPFMAYRHVSISIKDAVVFSLSQIIDLFFGLLFIFILPIVIDKKRLLIILNALVLVVLYSIIYSFVKERSYYSYFFSGDWSYQNSSIGSIFGNKQQWGIFLISAFCASIYSFNLFIEKLKQRKRLFMLVEVFYIVFSLLCFFCSVVAFCKTAIISFLIFFISVVLYIILKFLKKEKTRILGIAFAAVLLFAIVSIIVVNSIESLHADGLGRLIFNVFNTLENTSGYSATVRFALVYSLLEKFPSINLMFGMPKGVLDAYVRTIAPELIVGLHTGFIAYFGRTGIFGLIIYGMILFKLFKTYYRFKGTKPTLLFLYISFFFMSVLLNLSESEILIFSSSMNGMVFNLILVTDATRREKGLKNDKNKNFYYCFI